MRLLEQSAVKTPCSGVESSPSRLHSRAWGAFIGSLADEASRGKLKRVKSCSRSYLSYAFAGQICGRREVCGREDRRGEVGGGGPMSELTTKVLRGIGRTPTTREKTVAYTNSSRQRLYWRSTAAVRRSWQTGVALLANKPHLIADHRMQSIDAGLRPSTLLRDRRHGAINISSGAHWSCVASADT